LGGEFGFAISSRILFLSTLHFFSLVLLSFEPVDGNSPSASVIALLESRSQMRNGTERKEKQKKIHAPQTWRVGKEMELRMNSVIAMNTNKNTYLEVITTTQFLFPPLGEIERSAEEILTQALAALQISTKLQSWRAREHCKVGNRIQAVGSFFFSCFPPRKRGEKERESWNLPGLLLF